MVPLPHNDEPHRKDGGLRAIGVVVVLVLARRVALRCWRRRVPAWLAPGFGALQRPHVVVLVLALIVGFAIAAVSYALVVAPCRQALRRWEYRRSHQIPVLDSSVIDPPEPAGVR
jgi:acetyltransferase